MIGNIARLNDNEMKSFAEKTREIFKLESNREKVGELAYNNYKKCFGCSQSILDAYQNVLGFRNDFLFKAIGGLQGGGGSGLTCGALLTGFTLISAIVGRSNINEGLKAILPALGPSQQLTLWFKPTYKSTVCSEITGVNWFDMNEVVQHYLSPKGQETMEKCARLTSGTAYKVAEILSQL